MYDNIILFNITPIQYVQHLSPCVLLRNQYRCLPCNKWFGRDTKRLIHHVRTVHLQDLSTSIPGTASESTFDADATSLPPATADSSISSDVAAAQTPSKTNDSSKASANAIASPSDASACSEHRISTSSVDSKPLASLVANTTVEPNSPVISNESSISAKRRNIKPPSAEPEKQSQNPTGTANRRTKKKVHRLTLTKHRRVNKSHVAGSSRPAANDRLFINFESAANSELSPTSHPTDAAPESSTAIKTEALQTAAASGEVGERHISTSGSTPTDESKSKLVSQVCKYKYCTVLCN